MSKKKHSKLGASSAKRWISCPGSVALVDMVPPLPPTKYSIEGTAAHELADICLTDFKKAPSEFIGQKLNGYTVTEDMAKHVDGYVAYIQTLLRKTKGELLIEVPFHLSHLHPELYGTCDAVIMEPFGTLHVIDFKYGAGLFIDVERNEQVMYYALGALPLGDFSGVTIHIYQPRVGDDIEPGRSWDCSVSELLEFGKFLRDAALKARKKDAPLKTGDHCRFCAAAAICPEMHKTAVNTAQLDFIDTPTDVLPDPQSLPIHKIGAILEHKSLVEKWLKQVEDYALLSLLRGDKINGVKLVRGRSRRVWVDEKKAEGYLTKSLGDSAFSKKLLTVSQAEKLMGKANVTGLYQTLEGRLVPAHESDKRKEVNNIDQAALDFADIEIGDNSDE